MDREPPTLNRDHYEKLLPLLINALAKVLRQNRRAWFITKIMISFEEGRFHSLCLSMTSIFRNIEISDSLQLEKCCLIHCLMMMIMMMMFTSDNAFQILPGWGK